MSLNCFYISSPFLHLIKLYQMEKWGRDIETIQRHDALRQEIYNAGRFMELVKPEAL